MYYRDCNQASFYYESVQVKVMESGDYTFNSLGSLDMYGSMYKSQFNPLYPHNDLLKSNDDNVVSLHFKLDVHLDVDMTYILVVTTSESKATGPFSIVVYGKRKVTLERLSK